MPCFARIFDSRVVELSRFDRNPSALFHPSVHWIPVQPDMAIRIGTFLDGEHFVTSPHSAVATRSARVVAAVARHVLDQPASDQPDSGAESDSHTDMSGEG